MSKKTSKDKTPSKGTNRRLELTEEELGQIQGGNGNGNGYWCADGRGGAAGGDDNGNGQDA